MFVERSGQGASMRPRVVLLTGVPGSGKSTLGRRLSEALRVPFVARDDVRGGLAMTAGAWGDVVVIVTSCSSTEQRVIDRNRADRLVAQPSVLRAAGVSTVDEHTAAMLPRTRAVELEMSTRFPVPVLTVDTTDGYDPDFDSILTFAIRRTSDEPA